MSKYKEIFTSPVGRLVQGDCYKMQETDSEGRPRVFKSGPKVGQPNPQIFIAVAFPKMVPHPQTGAFVDNWEFNELYALMDKVARVEWPALFPGGGACQARDFAWKLLDGDGYDTKGKANFEKEGFAGHWVLRFGSGYIPKALVETSPNVFETTDQIKRGFYVRVAGNITGNDSTQTPGLYLNLELIQYIGWGQEIVGGMDAVAAFGTKSAAIPQGMSAIPQGGAALPPPSGAAPGAPATPGGPPATPGAPAPGGPGGYAPPAGAPTPGPGPGGPPAGPGGPPAGTAPYTGYMGNGAPGAAAPPPPVSAPIATASPTKQMTAAATTTYEAYIQAGWTDDTLRANGLLV